MKQLPLFFSQNLFFNRLKSDITALPLYRSTALLKILFLLCMFIPPHFSDAQSPSVQWKTSVNVGLNGDTTPRADWIFDMITTSDGNYFAVGFGREDEHGNSHEDVPAYCLIGTDGRFLRDGLLSNNENEGRLHTVIEPAQSDAYFAGGFYKANGIQTGILVKINKTTLIAQHFELVPDGFIRSRIRDIININYGPGNTLNHLLIAGNTADPQSGRTRRWMAICDYDGNVISEKVFDPSDLNLPENDEEANSLDYEIVDNEGNIAIYTANYQKKSQDGSFGGHRRDDSDIYINKTAYNIASGEFTEQSGMSYSSITQGARDLVANAATSAGDIFRDFPPSKADQYPYGPKYKNICGVPPAGDCVDFSRDFSNWNEDEPVNGYYIEDWSDGSEDRPYTLILTDNHIVVSALLNQLYMWEGTNNALGRDAESGLETDNVDNCVDFSGDYYWGEAYVLFFNKNTLALEKGTHIGTWSGGDFQPSMIRTSDGGFAVSGSVTGCPEGLPPVGHGEHGIVVKLDATGEIEYRASTSAPGGASFCVFAVTEAPDGGLVIAGNSEDEGGIEGEENYSFVKFGSDCGYQNATISAGGDGASYIVGAIEEWTTDQTVTAQVVVPEGHFLKIKGNNPSSPITIRFADSRELYDFNSTAGVGIRVEPGGKLVVNNATLTGWSCDGSPRMWDGISVKSIETQPQDGSEGRCNLINASIVNARIGIAASATGWALRESSDDTAVTGSGNPDVIGSTANRESAPKYWHGGDGGARINAFNTSFINNKRSAIFMKYDHPNKSRFYACDFISDGPLVDANQRQQMDNEDYTSTIALGTHIHLSAWRTNVLVEGSEFTGSNNFAPNSRPLGIAGWDASFLVSGGRMENLKIGIEGAGTTGGLLANLSANGIAFNNILQGINLRNSVADAVRNCTFSNIPASDGIDETYAGICGEFNAAVLIEGNTFTGANPIQKSYGLVLRGTSTQGGEVLENDFSSTRYGNQFEGDNIGLTASCNTYTGIGENAWACLELKEVGMLQDQGSSFISENKADNQFFDACTPTSGEKHIYSEFAFGYFDKTGNPHPAVADCVSEVVNFDAGQGNNSSIECAVPDPPCHKCDAKEKYMQSDKTIKDRNEALRALIHTGVDEEGEKIAPNYADAIFVLEDRSSIEDKQLLIGTWMAMERYTDAAQLISATSTIDDKMIKFMALMTDIIAVPEGKPNTDLLDDNTLAMSLVNNGRWLKEGRYTPFIALNPELNKIWALRDQGTTPINNKPLAGKVYPNPFKDKVQFDLRPLDADAVYQLEVLNLLGEIVEKTSIQGAVIFEWHTEKLASGTYFYTIRSDKNERLLEGKIIKL